MRSAAAPLQAQWDAGGAPIQHLQPSGLYEAASNGYTHAISVQAPQRWLLVSGQGGENSAGELADDFLSQARQALANVQCALRAGGADMAQVVKISVLIVDHSLERFSHWQTALNEHWGSGGPGDARPRFPVCSLIPVPKLALPGMWIEVEAMAAITSASAAPLSLVR